MSGWSRMSGSGGGSCEVGFSPDVIKVKVPKGVTILEACQAAGIAIDAVCGGEGKCGRCRVRPNGDILPGRRDTLSSSEVEAGYVLACEATVQGDLEVVIPPRSRIREHQILVRSVERKVPELSPWLWKTLIEMVRSIHVNQTPTCEQSMSKPTRTMMETSMAVILPFIRMPSFLLPIRNA